MVKWFVWNLGAYLVRLGLEISFRFLCGGIANVAGFLVSVSLERAK